MLNKITCVTTQNNTSQGFIGFNSLNHVKRGYRSYRYHNVEDPTRDDKIRASVGAVIGTALPLIYFARKQNGKIDSLKNLLNIKYGLPEIASLTAGSVLGGVLLGMLGEKADKQKKKINEGVFQFMNAFLPAVLVSSFLRISEKHKFLGTPLGKFAGIVCALVSGMYAGAKFSNIITDPKDIHPDRKLTIKDAAANVDDLIGALVLAKFPLVDNLNIEKALPAVYSLCGYRAGQTS